MIALFIVPSFRLMVPRIHCAKPDLRTSARKFVGMDAGSTFPEAPLKAPFWVLLSGDPMRTTSRGVVATVKSLPCRILATTVVNLREER